MSPTTLRGFGHHPLWFGQVLTWTRDGDHLTTRYLGNWHEMTYISSRQAQDLAGDYFAGWCLRVHPEDVGSSRLGPFLSSRRESAQMKAEAWILARDAMINPGAGAPRLERALTGAGAGFGAGRSATRLSAYANPARAEVDIRVDLTNELVGSVAVTFTAEDPAAAVAGRDKVVLTWTSRLAGGAELGTFTTWGQACSAIGATT